MKNINIGIANLILSKKLTDSTINNNLIVESKNNLSDYINIIKNSPILQLEFKVYDNIEHKHIDNDMFIKEYINNNIKLFEVYTIEEINIEHAKLQNFITEDIIKNLNNENYNLEKVNLFNSINSLIVESLKIGNDVNVNEMVESFIVVFNHIKNNKQSLVENINENVVNEDVIEIAVDKFNKKYKLLDESDKYLLNNLIKSSESNKKTIFEAYKTETLSLLEQADSDDIHNEITSAIKKINEMKYDEKTIIDTIINLHEFKKELL
jgi:hypothetical protein